MLCAWSVLGVDPFSLLGESVDSMPEPIQMLLCDVMMPFMFLHGFSFMVGTGILALLALRAFRFRLPESHAIRPLIIPCLSIAWLALQTAPFLQVPAGSWIRPMGWAMYTMLSALGLMIFSLSASIASLRTQPSKITSVIAILLSLAIIVVPSVALHAIAQIKGFNLSP